jgi:CelD/BcsL family acetyltransferase involved in cellulose biosynthesis
MNQALRIGSGVSISGRSLPVAGLRLAIVDDVESLADAWRGLEASACVSPYQRHDFTLAWTVGAAAGDGVEPRIGVVRDAFGQIVMILPFGRRRRGPLALAAYLGGSHLNIAMPLAEKRFLGGLDVDSLRALLATYCREADVDLLALRYQPETWLGQPHPFLALPRRPSPDAVARLVVEGPRDALVASLQSKDARSKLRRKDNKLAKAGFVIVKADTPQLIDRLVGSFLRQKAAQLAEIGADDPFARAGVGGFLAKAAKSALGTGGGLEFAGLVRDEEVLAVRGVLRHGQQLSLMVQSYDATHDMARFSAGEALFANLLSEEVPRGLEHLDFGVGDARYKRRWSNAMTPMFDLTYAATPLGRIAAQAEALRSHALRSVKQNLVVYEQLRSLRARVASLRRGR